METVWHSHTMERYMHVACFPPSPCKLSFREYYPFLIQVEFAKLLTCCEHTDSGQSFCILRMFEKVEAIANGQKVLNDRECPLLFQLDILLLVPSTCIISAVSIVHECSSDCKFIPSTTTSKVLEREIFSCLVVYSHMITPIIYFASMCIVLKYLVFSIEERFIFVSSVHLFSSSVFIFCFKCI